MWSLSANGNRDSVNGFLAIGGSDLQLAAARLGAAILLLLLGQAHRYAVGRKSDDDLSITPCPGGDDRGYPADGNSAWSRAKTVVPGNCLLIPGRPGSLGPRVCVAVHGLVTKSRDGDW